MKRVVLFIFISTVYSYAGWQTDLSKQLPLLGHRNWIVIADSAYPLQTAPGIQTVYAEEDQLAVVGQVLELLAEQRHVKPVFYLDSELSQVSEKYAPGISRYRKQLAKVLDGSQLDVLPHEAVIAKLDEAGKTFKVLIIKTNLTLPYSSVFIRLDCGYWDSEAENELRKALEALAN
ncbi:MAG: RbsD/FucU domain-containing protein [Pontiella sp.]